MSDFCLDEVALGISSHVGKHHLITTSAKCKCCFTESMFIMYCVRAGVLGRRGFAVESAAGRICRKVCESTNVMVCDLAPPKR